MILIESMLLILFLNTPLALFAQDGLSETLKASPYSVTSIKSY